MHKNMWFDVGIVLFFISLLALLKMELAVCLAFVLFIPYLLLTKRRKLIPYYVVAIFVGFLWGALANGYYNYEHTWNVLGLTLFPFFVWPIGLFGVFLLWTHLPNPKSFYSQLLLYAVLFGLLLIGIETLVYHVFHLRNIATGLYAGLPICNCIHAPLGMQISYFLLGPLYFTLCSLVKHNFRIQRVMV